MGSSQVARHQIWALSYKKYTKLQTELDITSKYADNLYGDCSGKSPYILLRFLPDIHPHAWL